MNKYNQFHGEMPMNDIGRELRKIATKGQHFKIVTGYGSICGCSKSKAAALKSLGKMKREGLILDYIPGEMVTMLILDPNSYYRCVKDKYWKLLSRDSDKGNDGVIYVFC